MTVGRFSNFQSLATTLIARYGEEIVIRRSVDGVPANPNRPFEVTRVVTEHTANAVFTPFASVLQDAMMVASGGAPSDGFQEALISAKDLSITPSALTDQVTRKDGSVWNIEAVETIAPNEDVILHTLRLVQ
jgi:hypothetical protein